MSPYHAVSVTTGGVQRYVIWIEGNDGPDRLAVDGGRIVSWDGMDKLRLYAARRRWTLADEAALVVDLDAAAAWVHGTRSGGSPEAFDPALLLNAWNLCWDVARSVDTTFDDRREQRDHVYDKLFWATNVPVTSPAGEPVESQWSAEEIRVLRDVLSEGISLAQAALAARE
jgi:hypothetical protein